MVRHDWPMNVRELEQCLRAAIILAEDGEITIEDLPAALIAPAAALPATTTPAATAPIALPPLDRAARIAALFAAHDGNVSAVARELRTSRSQLRRLMVRYGIAAKPG
jgi:transcriptional regulator of acetoin/glycerol metabolism